MRNNILLPSHLMGKDINILVIGDTHFPSVHPDYLEFCHDTYKRFNCNYVIQIGDLVDNCCFNYHEKDPEYISAKEEMERAKHEIVKWGQIFPYMAITTGNHCRLIHRKAKTAGLLESVLRPLEEIFEMPDGWKYHDHIDLHNVRYIHGDGYSGKYPFYNAMINSRCNMVLGHTHSVSALQYHNNGNDTIWGMSVGCGIDETNISMKYAKYHRNKPVISCGVVLNNGKEPMIIHMR